MTGWPSRHFEQALRQVEYPFFTSFFMGFDSVSSLIDHFNQGHRDVVVYFENAASIPMLAREIEMYFDALPKADSSRGLFSLGAATQTFKLESITDGPFNFGFVRNLTFDVKLVPETCLSDFHLQLTAELWRRAASQDHVAAMFELGMLLLDGAQGVERNAVEAEKLLRDATDHGHIGSMFELGVLLQNGAEGVERNAVESERLLRDAANSGLLSSFLDKLLRGSASHRHIALTGAITFLRDSDSHRHITSIGALGLLLRDGAKGIERNLVEAVKLLHKTAYLGHLNSICALGALLRDGAKGVNRDVRTAEHLLRKGANRGHLGSKFELGVLLRGGVEGAASNAIESERLLQEAVNRGHVEAMFELARLLEKGAIGVTRNEVKAVELYRSAAGYNNTRAMAKMGSLLEKGAEGVEQNVAEAVSFYRRAAECGSCRGSYRLGLLLEKGAEGVEQNIAEAGSFYRRAAELAEEVEYGTPKIAGLWRNAMKCGDVDASYRYGLLVLDGKVVAERNVAEAVTMLRYAADGGNLDAKFKLGLVLRDGADGVEQNAVEAEKLLRDAANRGHLSSMCELGVLLRDGAEGVERNAKEAEKLFRDAANSGEVNAMLKLGLLLQEGAHGVARNLVDAAKFWRQAADLGEANAMIKLSFLLLRGEEGLEQDAVQAVALLRNAVDAGEVDAMLRLGFLLQEGADGVKRNPAEAASLFWKAADRGDAGAMVMLGLLLREGADGVEEAAGEARFGLPLIPCDGRDLAERAKCRNASALAAYGVERAKRRNSSALTAYGISRLCGASGVGWNMSEAIIALRRAVERGNGQAAIMMSYLVSRGKCSNYEFVEAMKRFEVSWATWPDPETLSSLDVMDAARALLSMDINDSRNPTLAKSLLEKLHSYEPAYAPALHELALLYEKGDEGVPKNEEKARELYSRMVSFADVLSLPPSESAIMKAGQNYPSVIEQILRVGKSKPKTCLLVTLGGGARGKTATMNSLRRVAFVVEHVPTDMAAFNRCVVEPSGEGRDEEEIVEIAFQDSSMRVNASRLYDISLPAEGISPQGNGFTVEAGEKSSQSRKMVQSDVIEQVRRSVLHDSFPQIVLDGSFVQIWDMAGQYEYEMAHSMVVGRASLLVFVTNLEKVENETTRLAEVRVLCYWMQLAFLLVHSVKMTRAIIVATRKGSCRSVEESVSALRSCLAEHLDPKVYEAWVLEGEASTGFGGMPRIIAIENSESLKNAESSGRGQLERTLQVAAEEILELRESVPLRWLAFVEKLEQECMNEKLVYLSREQALELAENFPGFADDYAERENDVLAGLKCFASMGRLVLWEVEKEEWYVFPDVEKVIKLLGRTTAPEKKMEARLSGSDLSGLAKGRISQRGLFRLWDGYSEDEKGVMLKLLCRFDLLMILQGDEESIVKGSAMIGIPARMRRGWDGIKFGRREGEEDVVVVTRFDIALPQGLIGGLMAWMHRKIVERRGSGITGHANPFPEVRANAALLKEDDGSRVFLRFEAAERTVRWVFRGFAPMTLVRMYLKQLESYLKSPVRNIEVYHRHILLAECKYSDCKGIEGSRKTVEVRLKKSWVDGEDEEALMDEIPHCPVCYTPWDTSKGRAISDSNMVKTPKRTFDVFISHAGPDKHRMALPLHKALKGRGVHSFLDIVDLKLDPRSAPQVMMQAMGEARIGVFILSPEFAGRRWPLIELQHFLGRSEKQDETNQVALLPIFLRLGVYECRSAREKVYAENSKYHEVLQQEGFFETARLEECDVETASSAFQKLSGFSGIVANSAASNLPKSDAEIMQDAVEQIVGLLDPNR